LCERAVLVSREQIWLDVLFSTLAPALIYNFARDCSAPMLGHKHTDESKQAISKSISGENHPNFGKSHSDETKIAIGMANGKFVYVYDENNVLVGSFYSYARAAAFLGVHPTNVSRRIDTGRRNIKGFLMSSTPLCF